MRPPELFARAAQEPSLRRPADAVRLALATVGVILACGHSGQESTASLDLFHVFNDLPGGLRPVFDLLYDAGLYGPLLLVTAALVARRWALVRDLVLAGLLALLVARGLGLVLENGFHGLHDVVRSHPVPTFPSARLAVIVAIVATAGPWLGRSVRRLGWSLSLLLVPTELYLGVALPRSLVCALLLGWGLAAAVHLALGSPGGRATVAQVAQALGDLGLAAEDLSFAVDQGLHHTLVYARDADGPLVVKVLGRDETDARLLVKAWRALYLKTSGRSLFLTREQEVQHDAYLMLLARDAGARVPRVLTAGTGGTGTALLVERDVGGSALADLTAEELDDALLADAWHQAARLRTARIAHGRLNTRQLRRVEAGAAVVSFGDASAVASPEQLSRDVAELLATTAVVVGHERAVRAALQALPPEALAEALPLVQPAALSRQARSLCPGSRGALGSHLEELRDQVVAATGAEPVELEQLHRVRPASLVLAAGTIVGVGALLSSVGDPGLLARAVARADASLLLLGTGLALLTSVGYAVAFAGSVRRPLPAWSMLRLQLAGTFSNVAFPLGSQALQVRYLQRQGEDAASAVAAGGVVSVVGTLVVQVALVPLALYASPQRVHTADIPRGTVETVLLDGTLAVLAVSAAVLVVPALRRYVGRPVRRGLRSVLPVLRSPRQLSLLLGGNVVACVAPALALAAALAALGSHPSVWALVAVTVATALVASWVPFPGGSTAVTGVGLAAAVSGLGVPQTSAVAGVLLYQAMTTVVPSALGWLCLRSLLAAQDL